MISQGQKLNVGDYVRAYITGNVVYKIMRLEPSRKIHDPNGKGWIHLQIANSDYKPTVRIYNLCQFRKLSEFELLELKLKGELYI